MPGNLSALQQQAARNLVTKYLKVKPGESVIVESWPHTMSMSAAVVDEVRRAGGTPLEFHEHEEAFWNAVDRKQFKVLGTLSKSEWAALKAADAYVQFWGPGDAVRAREMGDSKWGDQVYAWHEDWYEVARKTGLRGIRMGVGFVTESRASAWKTSVDALSRQFLRAGLADPEKMLKDGRKLAGTLKAGRKVQIRHRNGTELEVALGTSAPRIFAGSWETSSKYGRYDVMSSFPTGVLMTALDSKTAEGTIMADRPSVADLTWFPLPMAYGGRFEFHDGKLTSLSYTQGGARIQASYAKATAGKDRTGILSIGLNPEAGVVPNFETYERGVVGVTLGGNQYPGGSNTSNFWARVALGGSEISVDGTPIVRAGKIL